MSERSFHQKAPLCKQPHGTRSRACCDTSTDPPLSPLPCSFPPSHLSFLNNDSFVCCEKYERNHWEDNMTSEDSTHRHMRFFICERQTVCPTGKRTETSAHQLLFEGLFCGEKACDDTCLNGSVICNSCNVVWTTWNGDLKSNLSSDKKTRWI